MDSERILNKLDTMDDRLARIEAIVARHDERSAHQHERLLIVESGSRRILWGIITGGAGFITAVVTAALTVLL
jgi:hypothetical protein